MDIRRFLTRKAGWEKATGELDRFAQPVREDQGEIPVRILRSRTLVRGTDGRETISDTQIHMLPEPGLNDCFTYEGRKYFPVSIEEGLGTHDAKASFWIVYL